MYNNANFILNNHHTIHFFNAMIIFPAIDIVAGKAVRLFKGDYSRMTIYNEDPVAQAKEFERLGATHLHLVDLEGARDGGTPNFEAVKKICDNTSLFVELGGGIRSMDIIDKYLSAGVDRVILGTAAVTDKAFLCEAVESHGEKIAVGADIKNGRVAIKGWLEESRFTLEGFCESMSKTGVGTLIVTDVSKDGAMKGANLEMYRELSEKFSLNFTASGGVSSLDDIKALAAMKLYGAIIGKAYYEGAVDIAEAIKISKE